MKDYIEDSVEEINKTDQNDQNLMTKEDIASKASELIATISSVNRELDELRAKCRHKDNGLKQINSDNKSELLIICDDCHAKLGYPSLKEINEWKNH